VLAVNLENGMFTVGVALVADEAAPREPLLRALNRKLSLGPSVGAKVLFIRALPRMANGKLDRMGLHRQFGSPGASPPTGP
jgi:hypothetical protein